MENLIQYTNACEVAIFSYLKTNNLDNLISQLLKVERHAKRTLKGGKNKSLWFRFSQNDTLATDISDIKRKLNPKLTFENNTIFLKENMEQVIALNGNLLVFYS